MRAWILMVVAACAPTETGNPATLSLSAHSSDSTVADIGSGTGLRIDEAWVGLGDIRFARATQCDDVEIETQIDGPIVSDLAASPLLLEFDGDEASYCELRVRLQRIPAVSSAPADAVGATLYISGRTSSDTPFVLASRIDPELEIESEGEPFGVLMPLVLSFDVARWFAGIDVSSGAIVDGIIRIDDENNDALLEIFEDNVEETLELYDDLDADGRRDDGEPRLGTSRVL